MFEDIFSHLPEALGLGAVIVGISGWFGKYLSSRLLESYKTKSLMDIEALKMQYQEELRSLDEKFQLKLLKAENHLQISKSTYELLFDKKVLAYKELMELRLKYYRFKNESVLVEEDPADAIEIYYTYFIQCKTLLENNALYISPELATRFSNWMVLATECFKQESIDGYEVHGLAHTNEENAQNVYFAQFPARNALVNQTQGLMEEVFEQIDIDLSAIRSLSSIPLDHGKCS